MRPGKVFFEQRFTPMKNPNTPVGDRNKKHIWHRDHTFTVSIAFYNRAVKKGRMLYCNVCRGSVRMDQGRHNPQAT